MHTACVDVRNFLDSRGAIIQKNSSRRVVMTLVYGLYEEVEEREAAVQTEKLIVENGRCDRQELHTSDQPTPGKETT